MLLSNIKTSRCYISRFVSFFELANVFNNYFSSIGEKTRSKARFSNKNYTDYLHGETFNSFFITTTDSEEITSIMSLLNNNKSSGPNSIPKRTLKLMKKDILKQLVQFLISLLT